MPLIQVGQPRGEAVPTGNGSPGVSSVPVPVDNAPIPGVAMVALKIYAFGGLAFMIAVVLGALSYWVWIVVIKREFADSPPELDLHPDRMRKREIARIARLKAQKEHKVSERRQQGKAKFNPPPIILSKKNNRERSTILSIATIPETSQLVSPSPSPSPRKSSMSTSVSPAKRNKRVSWASSTSTLDVDGNASIKPLDKSNPLESKKSTSSLAADDTASTLLPLPPHIDVANYTPPPRARTSVPHTSAGLAPRDRTGKDLISATTPDMAINWAKPSNPIERCNCATSVDPLDISGNSICDIHR